MVWKIVPGEAEFADTLFRVNKPAIRSCDVGSALIGGVCMRVRVGWWSVRARVSPNSRSSISVPGTISISSTLSHLSLCCSLPSGGSLPVVLYRDCLRMLGGGGGASAAAQFPIPANVIVSVGRVDREWGEIRKIIL